MKRFIAIAAACMLAVAIYAVTASGTPQAVTPKQFSALSKKVTTLTKKLNSVTKELAAVETCAFVAAVPIAQFGDPTNGEGYAYQNTNHSVVLETALDVSTTDAAQGYALVTNADCANVINGSKKRATVSLGGAHR